DRWSGTALPIIKGTWTSITEAFRVGKEKVSGFLTGALNVIKTVWKWTPLGLIVSNWSKIMNYFKSIPGKVRGFFTTAINFIKAVWRYTPLGMIISNWGRIMSFFKGIPGKVKSVFGNAVNWLVRAGSGIMRGLRNGVSNGYGAVSAWVRSIPGRVRNALGNTGALLYRAGAAIINSLLSGLRSAYGKVQNFVSGIAGWIRDHKGPISYDRRLLTPAGRAIMDSLRKSMEGELPKLKRMLDTVTEAIAEVGANPEIRFSTSMSGSALRANLAGGSAAALAPAGAASQGAVSVSVEFESTGDPLIDVLVDALRKKVRVNGGDVQRVLGAGARR